MAELVKYSTFILFYINLILVLSLIIGKFVFSSGKIEAVKSYYALFIIFLFGFYFLSLIFLSILEIYAGKIYYAAIFTAFLVLPSIIGKFSSYEKINLYMNIQIVVLIINIFVLNFLL